VRVALTLYGRDLGSIVGAMGNFTYWVIVDVEDGRYKVVDVIENKGLNVQVRRGLEAALQIINKGVDAVITAHLGYHPFGVFKSRGIKIYIAENCSGEEAIKKLINGELTEVTEVPEHRSRHGHGYGRWYHYWGT